MQNFPRNPKIALRTARDHSKHTKISTQNKCPSFLYYFPPSGSQVREPSVYDKILYVAYYFCIKNLRQDLTQNCYFF